MGNKRYLFEIVGNFWNFWQLFVPGLLVLCKYGPLVVMVIDHRRGAVLLDQRASSFNIHRNEEFAHIVRVFQYYPEEYIVLL